MAPDCALLPPLLCPIAGQVEATLRERNAADLELYAFARELVKIFERVRLRAFPRSVALSPLALLSRSLYFADYHHTVNAEKALLRLLLEILAERLLFSPLLSFGTRYGLGMSWPVQQRCPCAVWHLSCPLVLSCHFAPFRELPLSASLMLVCLV